MKLTIQERYALSHLEHTFVSLYEQFDWTSSRNPLQMFRELKNPNKLDIQLELEMFTEYISEKYQNTAMNKDQWFYAFQNWLKKTKRAKIEASSFDMDQPLYVVMYNHILTRSENILSFDDSLEDKYWNCWKWLTADISSRGPEDSGSHNLHTKEWMEKVCRNPYMTAEENKSYYRKLIQAVEAGKFDDEAFQDYIMQHSAGLMIQIMDIKYPASMDKKGLDKQMLSVSNRIDRSKYAI